MIPAELLLTLPNVACALGVARRCACFNTGALDEWIGTGVETVAATNANITCRVFSPPIWDHKWHKNGFKTSFSKNHPCPFGVPNRMNRAHFGPILTGSNPLSRATPSCFLAPLFLCRQVAFASSQSH